MTAGYKGILLAALQVGLVASVGGKLVYDRATLPRVWARTVPIPASTSLRGRYVSLQLEVLAPDVPIPPGTNLEPSPPEMPAGEGASPSARGRGPRRWNAENRVSVRLSKVGENLVARPDPDARRDEIYRLDRPSVSFRNVGGRTVAVLHPLLQFFIPENISDPIRRPPGVELWVEVTIPEKGPPRPIRLGLKKDGKLTPLDLM